MTNFSSLQEMFIQRNCPPAEVLQKGGKNVEKHLSWCHECRGYLQDIKNHPKILDIHIDPCQKEISPIQIGDIRILKPHGSKEDWWFGNTGKYYNPPMVLILTEPEDGFIRVSQVFEDASYQFIGDGDIPLFNLREPRNKKAAVRLILGQGLFAEAWNVYGFPEKNIGGLVKRVSVKYVDQVLKRNQERFPYLDENGELFKFRINEIELGSYFSIINNTKELARQQI